MGGRRRRPRPSVCAEPGCPEFTDPGTTRCAAHARPPWRNSDERRPRDRTGWERQKIARAVVKRDRGICHWCGKPGATEADHVVELADGGADDPANMRAIHHDCNLEKMRARKAQRQGVG